MISFTVFAPMLGTSISCSAESNSKSDTRKLAISPFLICMPRPIALTALALKFNANALMSSTAFCDCSHIIFPSAILYPGISRDLSVKFSCSEWFVSS